MSSGKKQEKEKTMTEVILFLPFLIIAIMILLSD